MRRTPGPALLGAITAAVLAVSCAASPGVTSVEAEPAGSTPGSGTAVAGEPDIGTVEWGACAGSPSAFVELECGSIQVPLDYDEPDGETIDIALVRSPTADDDERIGSLLFNPGGPGGSGIDFLSTAVVVVPPDLARRFDLVSFDPRGVGQSSAVDCDTDVDDNVPLLSAGDDAGWAELVAAAEELPEQCSQATAQIAPFVGTNNAARDLDEIRAALGDEQLSYVGFSYGTRLGATYAEMFPDRVRALVLDGAVKPTDDFVELDREQVVGFDRAFESFADACDADADCALRGNGPTRDVYLRVVEEIGMAGSFPTDDADRVLTAGELQLAMLAALYSTQLWPIAAEGLALADSERDGTLLHALVDSYVGREPDGSYDDSQAAGLAINCADDPQRPPTADVRAAADDVASRSVWFTDLVRADTGCLGTPDPVDPLLIGEAAGAAPLLVIGNTGDPATPYEWAVELADLLDSAVLFTVEAEGHTAFLSVECVEDIVVDYLVDLVVPEVGSSCADAAASDPFPAPGEGEFDQAIALFDCLRDNGIDLPDVSLGDLLADPTGEVILGSIDPTDPEFSRAVLACADLVGEL